MPSNYRILVLMPLAGLLLDFLSHIILSRRRAQSSPYGPVISGAVLGLIATIGGSAVVLMRTAQSKTDLAGFIAFNALTYLALSFGYFAFVNLNLTSIRIRVLLELLGSGGEKRLSSLLAGYNTDQMTALRLQRLVGSGDLLERCGRYYRGRLRFLAIARVFDVLRYAVLGSRGRLRRLDPVR